MDLSSVPDRGQELSSDHLMLATSNHYAMLKQVEATHAPDGHQFAVKPLLHIIEDIFQRAALSIPGFVQQGSTQAQLDLLGDKTFQSGFFDNLSFTINKVSSKICCKRSDGGDAHATTLRIFNILGSYAWDAKVVLAMAAFALNYGEFWVVAKHYHTNPLAKSVALLKQLQKILELAVNLESEFEALSKPIKAMLDLVKCIVEFKELPSQYISPDTPEMMIATAHIPTAVYWTIRSIVACSAQIMGLAGMGHDYIVSPIETWEISSLANKTNSIHTHLKDQLYLCYKIIDEKRHVETHQALVKLNETVDYLRALMYDKDDQQPLLEGSTKKRASLGVLRRRHVLLLITDLDVSLEGLLILEHMYQESRKHPTRTEFQYEVVWMPVVDGTTEETQRQFETLQGMMPWYSIHDPLMVNPAVISYFKEHWNFKKKPILVVLDIQGKVVNANALHMIWIWESLAIPFTSAREEALWREEVWTIWRLELLTGSIDPVIPVWVDERKFVCLYGGEDIVWIRKFTKTAQAVADFIGLPLEMLYVGKSNPKEKVRINMATIAAEKLSHTWPDLNKISFFWVRLESMWHSKMQHSSDVEKDPILLEIATILSFDGSNTCWAGIYRGSEMAKAKGETILKSFCDFNLWKKNANDISFIPALNQRLREVHSPDHCNHLVLPGISGTFPERVVCSECNRQMEKLIMYQCCN